MLSRTEVGLRFGPVEHARCFQPGAGDAVRADHHVAARAVIILRVIYGLLLLAQLWFLFRLGVMHRRRRTIDEIQAFAEDAFIQFAGLQGIGPVALDSGAGRRDDRRRAPAQDVALPAGQPALECRDRAGQAGRADGARRRLRRAGAADRQPADALRRPEPGQHFLCLHGHGDGASLSPGFRS